MQSINKLIPVGTKVYKTLANCCRHQSVIPRGVQPVFSSRTNEPIGFARLPEKADAVYVHWLSQ